VGKVFEDQRGASDEEDTPADLGEVACATELRLFTYESASATLKKALPLIGRAIALNTNLEKAYFCGTFNSTFISCLNGLPRLRKLHVECNDTNEFLALATVLGSLKCLTDVVRRTIEVFGFGAAESFFSFKQKEFESYKLFDSGVAAW
jgi:hypothetical protein